MSRIKINLAEQFFCPCCGQLSRREERHQCRALVARAYEITLFNICKECFEELKANNWIVDDNCTK